MYVSAVLADYRMTVCEIPYRWRAEKISVPLGNRNLFFISVCNKKKRGKTMKEKTQNAGITVTVLLVWHAVCVPS